MDQISEPTTAGLNDADDRLKIFISYSRRDSEMASALVQILEESGFDVTIDTRDLPFGEEWQQELRDFIHGADTVVWLVSPASVGSRWVNWELGEVQRAGKRLFPVVAQETEPESLPEALGKIQLLPPKGIFEREAHLEPLVAALHTDRGWIKEHTRLGMIARAWEAGERGGDQLLRGKALRAAEDWRASKPAAAPPPDSAILNLLAASEQGAKRRLRTLIGSLAGVVVMLAGLAVYAFIQQGIAVQNERTANQRNARLSIPIAASLRDDGSVQHATLLLLEAAKQFTDETAPSVIRIEMERTLKRAAMELRHEKLPDGVVLSRKGDHLLKVGKQDNHSDFAIDVTDNEYVDDYQKSEELVCTLIYDNQDTNYVPDQDADVEFCYRKGAYLMAVSGPISVGTAGGSVTYRIFYEEPLDLVATIVKRYDPIPGNPIPDSDFNRPYPAYNFTWVAGDGEVAFAHSDHRQTHYSHVVYRDERPDKITETITENLDVGFVHLLTPQSLLVSTGKHHPNSVDPATNDRWLIQYDMTEQSMFTQDIISTGYRDIWSELAADVQALNTGWGCQENLDNKDIICEMISRDGQWRLVRMGGKISLFKSGEAQPFGEFDFDSSLPNAAVSFYDDGPELVIVDDRVSTAVSILSPPESGNRTWTRRRVHSDDVFLGAAEHGRSLDMLLVVGVASWDTWIARVVSISTGQVWRELRTVRGIGQANIMSMPFDYPVARFLNDGRLFTTTGTIAKTIARIHRFPPLSELVVMLEDIVPDNCRPATPGDWRTSACWPDWVH